MPVHFTLFPASILTKATVVDISSERNQHNPINPFITSITYCHGLLSKPKNLKRFITLLAYFLFIFPALKRH